MKELQYPFEQGLLFKNRRALKKQLLTDGTKRIKKNIAVLAGSTVDHVIAMLELFLLDNGIEPTFYHSEYGKYYEDAIFGNEELDAFHPDMIYIHTSFRNIRDALPSAAWNGLPTMRNTPQEVEAMQEAVFSRFCNIWETLTKKFACPIIQNNFELPPYRLLGNRDAYDIHGGNYFVTSLNMRFYEYARTHESFYINDIHFLSASYGLEQWSDPKYWYMYKYALCVPAIPELAFNIANIIKSVYGKNKKAFALDLDNTLWGGVVGDDGVNGIEIGHETADAEAFHAFQSYIKAHTDLGIVLTVNSKNDYENAIAGLNHPEGVLKPDDFTIIKANWEAKSDNIKKIAAELNILPDSIVFVDDNPAERAIVSEYGGGVLVPDPGMPDEYIRRLDRGGYFEVTAFSADDLSRGEMYKANLQRAQAIEAFTDYRDYLLSLDMNAEIKAFEDVYLARITQLTNKSNQFNVTTRRYTESEIAAIAKDPSYITLYGKLTDKFGDNGVVSVVIGKIKENGAAGEKELHIDLWLMSCRVLKRDMELAMLDTLVKKAAARGITKIYGYYYPTAKNNMVKDLFARFGFGKISNGAEESEGTVWLLETDGYKDQNSVIRVESNE